MLAWRVEAIAGLMLFSGLGSAEVLALSVVDVDVCGGWVRVRGKGNRERRVPIEAEVAAWVQAHLLAERPDIEAGALFVVAKGPHRRLRPHPHRSTRLRRAASSCLVAFDSHTSHRRPRLI